MFFSGDLCRRRKTDRRLPWKNRLRQASAKGWARVPNRNRGPSRLEVIVRLKDQTACPGIFDIQDRKNHCDEGHSDFFPPEGTGEISMERKSGNSLCICNRFSICPREKGWSFHQDKADKKFYLKISLFIPVVCGRRVTSDWRRFFRLQPETA